jgi:hypothetical protein
MTTLEMAGWLNSIPAKAGGCAGVPDGLLTFAWHGIMSPLVQARSDYDNAC